MGSPLPPEGPAFARDTLSAPPARENRENWCPYIRASSVLKATWPLALALAAASLSFTYYDEGVKRKPSIPGMFASVRARFALRCFALPHYALALFLIHGARCTAARCANSSQGPR